MTDLHDERSTLEGMPWWIALIMVAILGLFVAISLVGCVSAEDFEPMLEAQREAIRLATESAKADSEVRSTTIDGLICEMERINAVADRLEEQLDDNPLNGPHIATLRISVQRLDDLVTRLQEREEVQQEEVEAVNGAMGAVTQLMLAIQAQAAAPERAADFVGRLNGATGSRSLGVAAMPTIPQISDAMPWWAKVGIGAAAVGTGGYLTRRVVGRGATNLWKTLAQTIPQAGQWASREMRQIVHGRAEDQLRKQQLQVQQLELQRQMLQQQVRTTATGQPITSYANQPTIPESSTPSVEPAT